MIDYHTRLITALKTIGIPVKYELTLSRGDATPLISYIGLNNYVIGNGDTVGYSRVQYQIKVWGTDIADLQKYAKKIDDTLRPIGFTRTNSNELYDPNSAMIQKIMTYEGLGYEEFE